jgi:formylglycine-generating enzyme required for sulfatase activity
MSADLDARIERLRRKLATLTDPEERADQAAAIAALEAQRAPPVPRTHTQTIADHAQVNLAVAGNVHGNIYLDGRRADAAEKLLAGYLRRLCERCGSLPLEGVHQVKQLGESVMRLDQVYTQLTVGGAAPRELLTGADLRAFDARRYLEAHTGEQLLPWQRRTSVQRPLTSDEQIKLNRRIDPVTAAVRDAALTFDHERYENVNLARLDRLDPDELQQMAETNDGLAFFGPALVTDAIADNARLVLLGEPGSGKSTALRYLTLTLAHAVLDQQVDPTTQLAGWDRLGAQGRLLPLFLPLLPFARALAQDTTRAGNADELWNYTADRLEPGNLRTGLATAVHAELAAGRVLLLLDGLDEVAGAESRRKVVRAVQLFAQEWPQCRMVVSCRVRAYEGEQNQAWQLPGWPTATLEPWNAAQQQHFIAAWYQAAVDAGALPEAQRVERAQSLQRAVAASPDLQRLADRPLLLTVMALVHLNDGRLPEDRVLLYSRCIDILLSQWEVRGKDQSEYKSLMDYIGLPDRDVQRLRPLLTRAAFVAHQAGTPDSPGTLGRDTLHAMTSEHLATLDHPDPYRGANKFLEYTDHRAGLIQASDAGDAYVFPHLTFQEYLAGLELTSGLGVVAKIMERRADDRWRIPMLLGVGEYVSGEKLEMPYQLLSELLWAEQRTDERRARDLILAAEIAEDVGWDQLMERGGATFKKLRADLAQALVTVVEGTALPAAERVRTGRLLGRLGDPRPGVCDLPPDMIPFAGGTFVVGNTPEEYKRIIAVEKEDDNERFARRWYQHTINTQTVTVATFELARYPVTNTQYTLFLADDGYNPTKPWWDDAGRAWLARDDYAEGLQSWRQRAHKQQPEWWDDERFGKLRPNHPVVGVSWYEAVAFCRWLTEHLNDGWVYWLPTEAEWEYAVRGMARRIYPWGKEAPDSERANFHRIYSGTTAVGCFPLGATPEGIHDLAGNVWEWTGSVYAPYPYNLDDRREQPDSPAGKRFALRGGGWNYRSIYLRASSRDNYLHDNHNNNVGFRLARRLPVTR